jgi:alkylation response protein AidB-like acyl-CoA dehydrogenase
VRLGLTPDQEFFQETTRKFLDSSVAPAQLRALASSPAGYQADWWRRGAELGWTSPLAPAGAGGGSISGAPLADLALIAYEWGRHAAPGPCIATNVAVHALAGVPSGSGADVHGALERLVGGGATAAWVRIGPDLDSAALRASVEGDQLLLQGVADVVEGAADADLLLVTAGSDVGLVEASAIGIRRSQLEGIDLTRRWARVEFDAVMVPVLRPAAEDGSDAERRLSLALGLQLAETVGAMQVAFDMTMDWITNRYSFGRPLGSYQEIKHRMADMRMWLEASSAITLAAIDAWDQERPDTSELASAAKAYVGHYGPELVQDCVQIHGGIGVTFDHDLHLFLRRVAAAVPAYGTPAQHQRRLADMVARRAA